MRSGKLSETATLARRLLTLSCALMMVRSCFRDGRNLRIAHREQVFALMLRMLLAPDRAKHTLLKISCGGFGAVGLHSRWGVGLTCATVGAGLYCSCPCIGPEGGWL